MGQDDLEFYSHHGPMTEPGCYTALFDRLPNDAPALAAVVARLGAL